MGLATPTGLAMTGGSLNSPGQVSHQGYARKEDFTGAESKASAAASRTGPARAGQGAILSACTSAAGA